MRYFNLLPKTIFYIVFLFFVFVYFVFFSHSDLYHTVLSSYAFNEGHYFDFYEYNQPIYQRNDYLPLLYAFFSIWDKLFHLLTYSVYYNHLDFEQLSLIDLFASKMLLAIFYAGTIYQINRIGAILTGSNEQGVVASIAFMSSAIPIFSVFAFNQYDIIGIFFSLLGVNAYIRNRFVRFSLCFAVSISIKYFALVAFLPLLVLKVKCIYKIALYIALALSFVAFQFILFSQSEIFLSSFAFLVSTKVHILQSYNFSPQFIPALFYFILVFYCWYFIPVTFSYINKFSLSIVSIAYFILFLMVDWHPQWIAIVIVYMSFGFCYAKNMRLNFLLWMIFGLLYFSQVFLRFQNNLDGYMLGYGFFRDFFGPSHVSIVPLFIYPFKSILNVSFYFCFAFIVIKQFLAARGSNETPK